MNITVVGTGYVGLVSGACLAEKGHKVICLDIDERKVSQMKSGKSPIYEVGLEEIMVRNYEAERLDYTTDKAEAYSNAKVIFIGVGTPERADGSNNLDYVLSVVQDIVENVKEEYVLIIIKSTVLPGTGDKIQRFINDIKTSSNVTIEVANNPEFLSQGTAVRDTLEASRIVIGTESEKAESILREIYKDFNIPIVSVNRVSAEMIKYASNIFLALKISYINNIANLSEIVGADIEDVALGMSYDPRIGSNFLKAGIGYGGSCFVKDTKALKYLADKNGYRLKTVEAAIEVNQNQKTRLFYKASDRLITFHGLNVAVLGLAFKPGTDDLREAPSIDNVELLLSQGANIYAYDPVAMENFKKKYPEGIVYCNSPEEALFAANVCFIFTEWGEIKSIKPEQYKKLMRTPLVYDGRNIYKTSEMKEAGIEYYSIGRN